MNSEREMVRKIKAGDPRAFEALVSQFESKIYAMGLRFTGNGQDALDICQEVFLRVFRFIGNFNESSKLSTWIYRIAANVCKDTVARKGRSQTVSLEVEDEGESYAVEIADTRFSPEGTALEHELRESIVNSIVELPTHYRTVIILRDIQGLSYDEIANTLELEVGTVKSRIARARERLRQALGGNISRSVPSKAVKGGDGL